MFETPHCFSFVATVKVCFGHLNFRFWLLFRISDLEFRIYLLISQKIPPQTYCVQQPRLWVKISFAKRESLISLLFRITEQPIFFNPGNVAGLPGLQLQK